MHGLHAGSEFKDQKCGFRIAELEFWNENCSFRVEGSVLQIHNLSNRNTNSASEAQRNRISTAGSECALIFEDSKCRFKNVQAQRPGISIVRMPGSDFTDEKCACRTQEHWWFALAEDRKLRCADFGKVKALPLSVTKWCTKTATPKLWSQMQHSLKPAFLWNPSSI